MKYGLYNGNRKIDNIYAGGHDIKRVYKGNRLIWEKKPTYDYFGFEYKKSTQIKVSGDVEIYVNNSLLYKGTYNNTSISFGASGGTSTVKIKGNLTDISFYKSSVTKIITPLPKSMGHKTSFFEWCYGCYDLISIPGDLFINCPEVTDFSRCFNIADIRSIPKGLFANCSKVTTFRACFGNNSMLNYIPDDLFSNCPNVVDFSWCFYYSTYGLVSIPENLFSNCTKVKDFSNCFCYCDFLTYVPGKLFSNCIDAEDFSYCFYQSLSIKIIPENLFSNCRKVKTFASCFRGIDYLSIMPSANLFINCPDVEDFSNCFESCGLFGNIVGSAPELWKMYPNANGEGCFWNIRRLSNYNEIPDTWK